nr:hypothetical protein Iba_chr13aCG13910 [Ipomoea batatas]
MEESMNDFRELGWLAMTRKVTGRNFPPPMDSRVLTEGFLRRTVGVNWENDAEGRVSLLVRGSRFANAQKRSNPENPLALATEMEESMNDFRELGWLAMAGKVAGSTFPPPMDRRVLTEGFLRRTVDVNWENDAEGRAGTPASANQYAPFTASCPKDVWNSTTRTRRKSAKPSSPEHIPTINIDGEDASGGRTRVVEATGRVGVVMGLARPLGVASPLRPCGRLWQSGVKLRFGILGELEDDLELEKSIRFVPHLRLGFCLTDAEMVGDDEGLSLEER